MDSMRSLQTKNGMVINLDERHYYVSRSLEEKNEGPYCFRSIKEAAEAIPDGNKETPSVLYLEQDGQMEHQIELVWLFRRNG